MKIVKNADKHYLCESRIVQCNLCHLKEAKEWNNVAGIIKNAGEHFPVSQELYNLFNFKKAKESNNAAGITKNA